MLWEFFITSLDPTFSMCDCIFLSIMILLWWLTWLVLYFLWYTGLRLQILLFSKYEDCKYLLLHQFKFLFHREVLVTYRKLLAFCFKVLWLTKNTLLKSIGTGTSSWWPHSSQSSCVYQTCPACLTQRLGTFFFNWQEFSFLNALISCWLLFLCVQINSSTYVGLFTFLPGTGNTKLLPFWRELIPYHPNG